MTSEATVPEAAPYAWEYAKDNGDGTYSIHIGRLSAEPPVYEGFKPKALYLTAALPHLSTAIHDAALEEAALKLDDLSEGYAAGAENTRRNWISPDNSHEDNEANRKDAAAQDAKSRAFSLGATAIRALKGKSIPAPAEGNEAEAAQPEAFIIERLIDGNRKVVLREQYDPREARFWADETARRAHVVTPLFACPPVPAAPAQAPGELVEQLRELRDRLNGESPQASKWPSIVEDAIAALTRQEQRGAVEQIIAGTDPMSKWVGSVDYSTYADFEQYLKTQLREVLSLKVSLEKARKDSAEDESLATFVDGRSASLEAALVTFRTVIERENAARQEQRGAVEPEHWRKDGFRKDRFLECDAHRHLWMTPTPFNGYHLCSNCGVRDTELDATRTALAATPVLQEAGE